MSKVKKTVFNWADRANVNRLYMMLPRGVILEISKTLEIPFATVSDVFRIDRARRTDTDLIYNTAVEILAARGITFTEQ